MRGGMPGRRPPDDVGIEPDTNIRESKEDTGHVHANRVHEDFMSGVRSGVNGTPTFCINGVRHDDSYETEVLLDALEQAAAEER